VSQTHTETESDRQASTIEKYYRLHAKIYDATRWSFLFGRGRIVRLAQEHCTPKRILEVGCGTGRNLRALAKAFPPARIAGLDVSAEMLRVARKSLAALARPVQLIRRPYDEPVSEDGKPFDLIVFSYALSMFNPGWEAAIQCARQDLSENGRIAVVDFHDTRWKTFRRWMGFNHVRMEGHLLEKLREQFLPREVSVRRAYAGLWRYMLFVGSKRPGE
jgi:S-adenosylmethionine-diacylgycerolhomoserine-N-methlytransferase